MTHPGQGKSGAPKRSYSPTRKAKYQRQIARTKKNKIRRLERHIKNHPGDKDAPEYLATIRGTIGKTRGACGNGDRSPRLRPSGFHAASILCHGTGAISWGFGGR